MRLFLQGLLDQTRRFQLPAELIVVEWNPQPDRSRLVEVLPAPSERGLLTVRYIEVPGEIHRRYRRAADIPLFQMIAKNVGIRRAAGRFVLCTNVDLLFADALCRRLADRPLRNDTYYRANRCDVPDEIDPAWEITRQLDWCARHVIRRVGRDPRYTHFNLEFAGLQDTHPFKKWLFDKLALGQSLFWSPEKRRFFQLDSFACGDFTLMSHEAWTAIRGYPELDLYSLHVDSLGLIAAAALGYRQQVFPREACTYHIDHPSGWEALSPLEKVRFLEKRPALDYSLVYEVGREALAKRAAPVLNGNNWGLADETLNEVVCRPPLAARERPWPRVAVPSEG
jgi:hypothetical protein